MDLTFLHYALLLVSRFAGGWVDSIAGLTLGFYDGFFGRAPARSGRSLPSHFSGSTCGGRPVI